MPYKGTEAWVTEMEADGVIEEKEAWRPWFATSGKGHYAPAGYATHYTPKATPANTFDLVTIRVAGHMVPTFMPAAAFSMFEKFLTYQPY